MYFWRENSNILWTNTVAHFSCNVVKIFVTKSINIKRMQKSIFFVCVSAVDWFFNCFTTFIKRHTRHTLLLHTKSKANILIYLWVMMIIIFQRSKMCWERFWSFGTRQTVSQDYCNHYISRWTPIHFIKNNCLGFWENSRRNNPRNYLSGW